MGGAAWVDGSWCAEATRVLVFCITQAIYSAFGGSGKGLQYRDLVCGLALLVHGSRQEKAKCTYLIIPYNGYYF